MFFSLKSTPIEFIRFWLKLFSMYRNIMQDFPTPESPNRSILNKNSLQRLIDYISNNKDNLLFSVHFSECFMYYYSLCLFVIFVVIDLLTKLGINPKIEIILLLLL